MKIDYNNRKHAENILKASCNHYGMNINDDVTSRKGIIAILINGHKTLRYIFVNAVLAKASNARINCIALQKRNKSNGAYNARTMCHKVLVKTIKSTYGFMDDVLGNSNEPFTNYSARKSDIHSIRTRSSRDNTIKNNIVHILQCINTMPQDASEYEYIEQRAQCLLKNIVNCARWIHINNDVQRHYLQRSISAIHTNPHIKQYEFIRKYLKHLCSEICGGESAVIVVATIESFDSDVSVEQVNVSDTTSTGCLDIDSKRFANGVTHCIEVKAKSFYQTDVVYAVNKVNNPAHKLQFIYHLATMNKSNYSNGSELNIHGIWTKIRSLERYIQDRLFDCIGNETIQTFHKRVLTIMKRIRVSNKTRSHVQRCLKKIIAITPKKY